MSSKWFDLVQFFARGGQIGFRPALNRMYDLNYAQIRSVNRLSRTPANTIAKLLQVDLKKAIQIKTVAYQNCRSAEDQFISYPTFAKRNHLRYQEPFVVPTSAEPLKEIANFPIYDLSPPQNPFLPHRVAFIYTLLGYTLPEASHDTRLSLAMAYAGAVPNVLPGAIDLSGKLPRKIESAPKHEIRSLVSKEFRQVRVLDQKIPLLMPDPRMNDDATNNEPLAAYPPILMDYLYMMRTVLESHSTTRQRQRNSYSPKEPFEMASEHGQQQQISNEPLRDILLPVVNPYSAWKVFDRLSANPEDHIARNDQLRSVNFPLLATMRRRSDKDEWKDWKMRLDGAKAVRTKQQEEIGLATSRLFRAMELLFQIWLSKQKSMAPEQRSEVLIDQAFIWKRIFFRKGKEELSLLDGAKRYMLTVGQIVGLSTRQ